MVPQKIALSANFVEQQGLYVPTICMPPGVFVEVSSCQPQILKGAVKQVFELRATIMPDLLPASGPGASWEIAMTTPVSWN